MSQAFSCPWLFRNSIICLPSPEKATLGMLKNALVANGSGEYFLNADPRGELIQRLHIRSSARRSTTAVLASGEMVATPSWAVRVKTGSGSPPTGAIDQTTGGSRRERKRIRLLPGVQANGKASSGMLVTRTGEG